MVDHHLAVRGQRVRSAQPILGVVHAPALDMTYMAVRGMGAIRVRKTPIGDKREKIIPSTTPSLDGSVVSFGMSYVQEESMRALQVVCRAIAGPADRHQARGAGVAGPVQGGRRHL